MAKHHLNPGSRAKAVRPDGINSTLTDFVAAASESRITFEPKSLYSSIMQDPLLNGIAAGLQVDIGLIDIQSQEAINGLPSMAQLIDLSRQLRHPNCLFCYRIENASLGGLQVTIHISSHNNAIYFGLFHIRSGEKDWVNYPLMIKLDEFRNHFYISSEGVVRNEADIPIKMKNVFLNMVYHPTLLIHRALANQLASLRSAE